MIAKMTAGRDIRQGDIVFQARSGNVLSCGEGYPAIGVAQFDAPAGSKVSILLGGTFVMQSPAEALCDAAREIARREDAEARARRSYVVGTTTTSDGLHPEEMAGFFGEPLRWER